MSYRMGTAANTGELIAQLNAFLTKGHALEPVYAGAGGGAISGLIGGADSVLETFTLTCTAAAAGAGTFSVVGSVSGALADATVGVAYAQPLLSFTILDGAPDWEVGDTIEFVMTPPWVNLRLTADQEAIWKAPGNDGAGAIYVGLSKFEDIGADYSNLRLGGFTGFDDALEFAAQPGAMLRPILNALRVGSVTYWFVANGRRAIVVLKVSGQYEAAYLGLIKQYAPPSAFPYPLLIGGSMAWAAEPALTSAQWRWSYSGAEHSLFPFGVPVASADFDTSTMRLRRPDGAWHGFQTALPNDAPPTPYGHVFPYGFGMTDLRENADGSAALFPILLQGSTPAQNFGELDGIAAVTGYANAAENTVTIGRAAWLVVQNVQRTGKTDYCAVSLQ